MRIGFFKVVFKHFSSDTKVDEAQILRTQMEVMLGRGRVRSQPLDAWNGIKCRLIDIINTDRDTEREFLILSTSKVGREVKNGEQFFENLENNYSEHCHVVEFLINLTEEIRLHVDDGVTKVGDELRRYLQDVKDYDDKLIELGLGAKCFVGREIEIASIMETLKQEDERKGLLICGMGGMGKTSLAMEICRHLYIEAKWSVYKVDLREETTLRDLIRITLTKLGEKLTFFASSQSTDDRVENNHLTQLNELLLQRCCDQKTNSVLLFDNIDDILEKDRQRFLVFVQQLVQKLTSSPRENIMRILFTAREKLLNSNTIPLLSGLIQETEIRGLNEVAAIGLFRMTPIIETSVDTVRKIVALCGNCPLAILSLCNSIRNTDVTAEKLLFNLQMTQHDAGGLQSFGVGSCLKQSFNRLNRELRQYLVMLSVFRTAKFDIYAANVIAGRSQSSGKALTSLDLVHLKSCHFVEIAVEEFSVGRSKAYCLHPLVVQFLINEIDTQEGYDKFHKLAKSRFIEYFDEVILSISSDLHTHPTNFQKSFIENKTHIQSFFNYVTTSGGNLQKVCVDSPSVVNEFRKDELCSAVLSDHERNQYYDQYIKYAKENGLILDEIHFKTMKTRLYFEIDRSHECHKLLKETEDLVNSNASLEEGTADPVLAHFYWMKGRLLNSTSHYKDALTMMERSISYYQKDPELFKTDIANIHNTIGVVYFNQKDYEKAELYHEKAIEVAKEQLSQEEVEAVGINMQVYYTNIATALVAQWQKQIHLSKESHSPLLIKAEEYYTRAVHHDPIPSESRAKKLTNRGKLYLKMKKYDDAEQDLLESLQIRKDVSVPPNANLTHAYHNIGYYYFLRGDNPKTENQLECFKKALEYYEEAKCQIRRGGLSVTDPVYKDIVKFHKLTLKVLNDGRGLEQIKQFYQDFESGKFNKKIRKWRNIDETMTKSERLASTGKNLEEYSESQSDASDSGSGSSSDQSSSIDITDEEDRSDNVNKN
ncbi:uncharacterized protein LOC125674181 isoform X1 [Ostrea edulis]|uniref:uncharacterized protein LOC125674181 isoform X1 n=2 Tax=Ostrea edulis TaxID=37623 RepID=UPI0024AFE677|nr:uncharacterized protein LOC125674181 isoform X1 [Ostrea edulis]